MTQPQQGRQLPIGSWLKRVDELLTERSNAALAGRGFTRLRWQLLACRWRDRSRAMIRETT
ncbi:MAG: hypothetical protein HGA45_25125 [Chloroflexales bacterium]|nr:hypothetical protein [Chloroflexales bacterium]